MHKQMQFCHTADSKDRQRRKNLKVNALLDDPSGALTFLVVQITYSKGAAKDVQS